MCLIIEEKSWTLKPIEAQKSLIWVMFDAPLSLTISPMNQHSDLPISQEIERAGWQVFFDEFSRQYAGKRVTMWMMSSNISAWRSTTVQDFVGIWTNDKGPQNGDIMVSLDSVEGGNLTRTFAADTHLAPTKIHWQDLEQTLTIELQEGSTVFLQFSHDTRGEPFSDPAHFDQDVSSAADEMLAS